MKQTRLRRRNPRWEPFAEEVAAEKQADRFEDLLTEIDELIDRAVDEVNDDAADLLDQADAIGLQQCFKTWQQGEAVCLNMALLKVTGRLG